MSDQALSDQPVTDPALADDAKARLYTRFFDLIPTAIGWRYLCHSAMLFLAMLNEMRAAPHLPDTVLALVPYNQWVHQHNYGLWLLGYFPIAMLLWWKDRRRFVHFLYVGGVLSLVRGLCIGMTGLGPVVGPDLNAGMNMTEVVGAWWDLVNPIGSLTGDAPHVWLTKDLFFSGHTATTFLLVLYMWRYERWRWLALGAHIFVVSTVFMSHLHYTIDVIGAWAITYCVFVLGQRYLRTDGFRRIGLSERFGKHTSALDNTE